MGSGAVHGHAALVLARDGPGGGRLYAGSARGTTAAILRLFGGFFFSLSLSKNCHAVRHLTFNSLSLVPFHSPHVAPPLTHKTTTCHSESPCSAATKQVIETQKERAAQFDDESDLIDAYVACGGNADKSGCVSADMLIKIIKHDFGLTIDIEELIRAIDTDGSGEIEFEEFKTLLS